MLELIVTCVLTLGTPWNVPDGWELRDVAVAREEGNCVASGPTSRVCDRPQDTPGAVTVKIVRKVGGGVMGTLPEGCSTVLARKPSEVSGNSINRDRHGIQRAPSPEAPR